MFKSKLINLAALAEKSGIPYSTLYNYKAGRAGQRAGIDAALRTKLANVLAKELSGFMDDLGFTVEISRKA